MSIARVRPASTNLHAGRNDAVIAEIRKRGRVDREAVHNKEVDALRFRSSLTCGPKANHNEFEARIRALVEESLHGRKSTAATAARLLQEEKKNGTFVDTFLSRQVLAMYARNGLEEEVVQLSHHLARLQLCIVDDVAHLGIMLILYEKLGNPLACRKLIDTIKRRGMPLATVHYKCLIGACRREGLESVAFEAFREMRKTGVVVDLGSCLALLSCCQSLPRAFTVVSMMRALGIHCNTIATYTALASVSYRIQNYFTGLRFLKAALQDGIVLDLRAYALLLKCLFRLKMYGEALSLFRQIVSDLTHLHPVRDPVIYRIFALSCQTLGEQRHEKLTELYRAAMATAIEIGISHGADCRSIRGC